MATNSKYQRVVFIRPYWKTCVRYWYRLTLFLFSVRIDEDSLYDLRRHVTWRSWHTGQSLVGTDAVRAVNGILVEGKILFWLQLWIFWNIVLDLIFWNFFLTFLQPKMFSGESKDSNAITRNKDPVRANTNEYVLDDGTIVETPEDSDVDILDLDLKLDGLSGQIHNITGKFWNPII